MSRALAIDARLSFATGIGTYLRQLLRRGVVRGLECDVLMLDPPEGQLPVCGASSLGRTVVSAPLLSPREQWAVPRAIAGRENVLWVPHLNIPLAHRGDLVVTLHDIAQLDGRPAWCDVLWYAYGRRLLYAIARRARVVLCDSHFTREAFRDFTGCDADRLRVVSLGVDEAWFDARAEPRMHPRPYFLYVGNIKRHKNVTGLLRAFASIRDTVAHDLVIAGPGEGLRSGDRAVGPLARTLGSRVVMTGRVADDELRRWVAGAAAVVLPSFSEGFGLPPLEAMACGRPALVARAGALPESCGDAALYCDPREEADIARKLVQIASDEVLVEDLTRRGKRRARELSWQVTARETREALREVLQAPH